MALDAEIADADDGETRARTMSMMTSTMRMVEVDDDGAIVLGVVVEAVDRRVCYH